MDENIKIIMNMLNCSEQDSKIVLENMLKKDIVKNAIKFAVKKDFALD